MRQRLKNVKSNGGNLLIFGFTYTAVNDGEKIGRNDPCPCGSGKKYKKCCLEQDRINDLAFDTQRFIKRKIMERKAEDEAVKQE